jgi:hypothetical protein
MGAWEKKYGDSEAIAIASGCFSGLFAVDLELGREAFFTST